MRRLRFPLPAGRSRRIPYFCTGLINAAEAVLQLADKAGPIQIPGIKRRLPPMAATAS